MTDTPKILSIDLGTSRVKVGVLDPSLTLLASASATYATLSDEVGMAEQRTDDWMSGIRHCVREAVAASGAGAVDAVVLTAQVPTLVAVSSNHVVIGNAITWHDSRADTLVDDLFDDDEKRRIYEVAGTPIDGRYLIPMHLRRAPEPGYRPAKLLSAKDFIYFALTGLLVTDPSTASGFGNYSLEDRGWSAELNQLWNIDRDLLPDVVDPTFAAALTPAGAQVLAGVGAGTPVFVGAADSVCAHHFITTRFPDSISVIDGSSTVIMATLDSKSDRPGEILLTPLADPSRLGGEMDLLATGSSIGWLAALLGVTPNDLEDLALGHPSPATNDVLFFPYLAGGEQGALWRTDLSGAIKEITLSTTRADLALALFEGIAFETFRCLKLLLETKPRQNVVSLAGSQSRHLGASLVGALMGQRVIAVGQQSPSILGAALIALDGLKVAPTGLGDTSQELGDEVPPLANDYVTVLVHKAKKYFAISPATANTTGRTE